MLGQVVINDKNIASCFHKVFRDAGCRIRRDIGQARSIVAFTDHHDRGAERDNNRFSSLILGIVRSAPFQMNIKPAETVARK